MAGRLIRPLSSRHNCDCNRLMPKLALQKVMNWT
jgi:hypothetical protein